ncbi:endolysin [Escherichia phage vB_EcoS_AKS96]|uniref:Lysozyme n=2 Tax=Rogunavirus TaxID=1920866 RepID=A0A067YYB7_9CAUD|nr:endolysin [Escherichia phage vB_EcoS_AKS96]YP_009056567.1 endolysin [Escherichia phage vB_EcoS_AHP42]AHI60597.1 endolysin [Escherichia phage vB_EcoS_AHP42]AHI60753.1 endolysin [Escherichia phage vB_EcoS_AKS96]
MSIKNKVIGGVLGSAIAIAVPFLNKHEGVEYSPYKDVAGVWTICAGITGPDVIRGKVYTQRDCDALLMKHLSIHRSAVDKALKVDVPVSTRAALYSFSFNVGTNAMRNSTVIRLMNRGDIRGGCEALSMWNKISVGGKKVVSKGLVNRRNAEIRLCVSEL